MANRKLTELPTLLPLNFDSNDLLYIVDVEAGGGDGISKSIPFSLLAGNSLLALSAYDDLNTLNLDYLSGRIDADGTAIANLAGGAGTSTLNILFLSSRIDTNFDFLSTNIDSKFDQISGNSLQTDILELSGTVKGLDSDTNEAFITAASTTQGQITLTTPQDPPGNTTDVNLGLKTTDSPQFAGLTVNSVNIDTAVGLNTTFRTDNAAAVALNTTFRGNFGTSVVTETVTSDKTLSIVVGGVTYKILLAT